MPFPNDLGPDRRNKDMRTLLRGTGVERLNYSVEPWRTYVAAVYFDHTTATATVSIWSVYYPKAINDRIVRRGIRSFIGYHFLEGKSAGILINPPNPNVHFDSAPSCSLCFDCKLDPALPSRLVDCSSCGNTPSRQPDGSLRTTMNVEATEFRRTMSSLACANCNTVLVGPYGKKKKCSACREAYYCNRECQVQHWRKSHSIECGTNATNAWL